MNTIDQILKTADKKGQSALSEYDSKRLLATYGIPVVNECVAHTPEEAADAAVQMGFPVVIKGLGMDRFPQLKSVYFNNYKQLVYLAQSNSEELHAMARQHADYLGLDYKYHECGSAPLSNVLQPHLNIEGTR